VDNFGQVRQDHVAAVWTIYRKQQTSLGPRNHISDLSAMKKADVQCPQCSAGYRRIELVSKKGGPGEYRCLVCGNSLEVLDGSTDVAYRLTVVPEGAADIDRYASPMGKRIRQHRG
jgi:hypothetical protein